LSTDCRRSSLYHALSVAFGWKPRLTLYFSGWALRVFRSSSAPCTTTSWRKRYEVVPAERRRELIGVCERRGAFPRRNARATSLSNRWSKNFDELPHRPRTRHPRGGRVHSEAARFRRNALSSADKSAAPCRVARSPVFYGRSRISAPVSRLPEGSRP